MTYIQLLRGRHINVFDLIKFARAGAANFSPTIAWTITLRDFGSAREFFDYCRGENKVCAGWESESVVPVGHEPVLSSDWGVMQICCAKGVVLVDFKLPRGDSIDVNLASLAFIWFSEARGLYAHIGNAI